MLTRGSNYSSNNTPSHQFYFWHLTFWNCHACTQFLSVFCPLFSVQTKFSFPFLQCAVLLSFLRFLTDSCFQLLPLFCQFLWKVCSYSYPFVFVFSVYNMILALCLLSSHISAWVLSVLLQWEQMTICEHNVSSSIYFQICTEKKIPHSFLTIFLHFTAPKSEGCIFFGEIRLCLMITKLSLVLFCFSSMFLIFILTNSNC